VSRPAAGASIHHQNPEEQEWTVSTSSQNPSPVPTTPDDTNPTALTPEREQEIRDRIERLDDDRTLPAATWLASSVNSKSVFPPEQSHVVEDVLETKHSVIRSSVGVFGDKSHAEFTAHARDDIPDLLVELDRVRAELAKYVGHEPTLTDEMAYLRRCLNDVYEVCDQAETRATRWEQPLPVPEWVATVRQAADGERPDNPDDKRRRIYIDGDGNGWLDQSVGYGGIRWVAPLAIFPGDSEPAASVRDRTNGLHEIGRCL
jgi:hypothetical protein